MIELFQSMLRELVDEAMDVVEVDSVTGGCISDGYCVQVMTGPTPRTLFVKQNEIAFLDNFECEADGLRRLAKPDVMRVPQPVAVGTARGKSWLVLPWVDQTAPPDDFFQVFGRQLAELHQATRSDNIGGVADNYLGAARQINQRRATWAEFVAGNRIGDQLRWAREQSLVDTHLLRDCRSIIDNMGDLLSGRDQTTSLLHGDLWSGNYLCDALGQPVLIDPAAYFGCREAEFGMLLLFGNCPQVFYDSYHETWPLPSGWQRRVDVYILYHLLNHLNLFGNGYLGQCRSLSEKILRQG